MKRRRIPFVSQYYSWNGIVSHPRDLWDALRRDISEFYLHGMYGWAPRDLWSLDNYLAKIISETLYAMSENTNGVPSEIVDMAKEEYITKSMEDFKYRGTKVVSPDDIPHEIFMERASQIWEAKLRSMAAIFKALDERFEYRNTFSQEEIDEGLHEFAHWYHDLWT